MTSLQIEDDNFLRSFIALSASIECFKYLRPVIVVDTIHLKAVYEGKIYAVVCADENEQIFPLAFGFGEEEGNDVCEWFLRRIRHTFGESKDLIVVSNRYKGIQHAMRVVYPSVTYAFCYRHLKENFKQYCKDPQISICFKNVVYAYDKNKCDNYLNNIGRISIRVYNWLESIGIENWCRAYCPKNRYNHMTSNFVESFNEAIKKARKLPITSVHEYYRGLCQKWFSQGREQVVAMPNNITQYAVTTIEAEAAKIDQSGFYTVTIREREKYVVLCHPNENNMIVNLTQKSCGCRKWNIDDLPCIHAIVVVR